MTSKEKLIGRAQRVQVAAQATGFRAQLVLSDNGIEVSAFYEMEYTRVFQIYMPYDSTDEMQEAILGSLAEFLTPGYEPDDTQACKNSLVPHRSEQKGGEA